MRFNLSLDDFSPHTNAGLYFESIYWTDRLIKLYPDIKINLFVPAAYARVGEAPSYLSRHLNWVDRVNFLSSNYSICLHGMYHRRSQSDFMFHCKEQSNNDEFGSLTYDQSNIICDAMINEFCRVGIKYNKVFRPPRWQISFGAAQSMHNRGFIIAGHKDQYKKCSLIDGLKWVSVNYHLEGKVPDGDIVAAAHTSNWTYNYFDETRFNIVVDVLSKNGYNFKFLEEWYD